MKFTQIFERVPILCKRIKEFNNDYFYIMKLIRIYVTLV